MFPSHHLPHIYGKVFFLIGIAFVNAFLNREPNCSILETSIQRCILNKSHKVHKNCVSIVWLPSFYLYYPPAPQVFSMLSYNVPSLPQLLQCWSISQAACGWLHELPCQVKCHPHFTEWKQAPIFSNMRQNCTNQSKSRNLTFTSPGQGYQFYHWIILFYDFTLLKEHKLLQKGFSYMNCMPHYQKPDTKETKESLITVLTLFIKYPIKFYCTT